MLVHWESKSLSNGVTLWQTFTKNYGKSPFLMGKSTISMAIFNSYDYDCLPLAKSV
jgi:hypothetical protein